MQELKVASASVASDVPKVPTLVRIFRKRWNRGAAKLTTRVECWLTQRQREETSQLAEKLDIAESVLVRFALEMLLNGHIEVNSAALRAIDLCGADPGRLIAKLMEFDVENKKLKVAL